MYAEYYKKVPMMGIYTITKYNKYKKKVLNKIRFTPFSFLLYDVYKKLWDVIRRTLCTEP